MGTSPVSRSDRVGVLRNNRIPASAGMFRTRPDWDETMAIAYLTLELRIENAHSLKDKRQVVRSLKDKLRASFNVSVAEIENLDLWQLATIGVVSISDSRDYLEGLMRNVESAATRIANNAGADVTDSFLDFV